MCTGNATSLLEQSLCTYQDVFGDGGGGGGGGGGRGVDSKLCIVLVVGTVPGIL